MDLIAAYDIVADGSDNFATRYLLTDACFLARRTAGVGGAGPVRRQISTFRPLSRGQRAALSLLSLPLSRGAAAGLLPPCEEAGVIGALTGVMGSMQAIEVIKELLGVGESLAGRVLIYDALAARFHAVKISWDPQNPLSGTNPTIADLSVHKAQ